MLCEEVSVKSAKYINIKLRLVESVKDDNMRVIIKAEQKEYITKVGMKNCEYSTLSSAF